MVTPQHSQGFLARHLLIPSKVTINLLMELLHRDIHKVLLLPKDTSKEGHLPHSKATLEPHHKDILHKVLLPRDILVIPNNLSGDK